MSDFLRQIKKESKILLSAIGLGSGRETAVGLDIGLTHFRAIKLTKSPKGIAQEKILIKEKEHIKNLKEELAITDEKVYINFIGDNLMTRRVAIPSMPEDEIEEALKWELKEQIRFDIEKTSVSFDIIRETEDDGDIKKIELMAIVYLEQDVRDRIRGIKGLGLNVQGVFTTDIALAAYVDHLNIVPEEEAVAIVDIGGVKSTISIIDKEKLCFTREIGVGGDTITDAMVGSFISGDKKMELSRQDAEKLKRERGITEDITILSIMRPVLEKFSKEIKGSLEYYSRRYGSKPINKIVLAGGGSKLKGLKKYFAKNTGLEVLGILPQIACANGLALLGRSSLNIIPKNLKENKKEALKNFSSRVLALSVVIILSFLYVTLSIRTANLRDQLDTYKLQWKEMKDIRDLRNRYNNIKGAIRTVSGKGCGVGFVMKELSLIVPDYVALEGLIISNNGNSVELSGRILQGERLSEFMSALEDSDVLEKIKLVFSEQAGGVSGEALDFKIRCDITGTQV